MSAGSACWPLTLVLAALTGVDKGGGLEDGEHRSTLHTAADPLVSVQKETVLRDASGPTDEPVQLFTVAPDSYPGKPGAPYGAGHCEFTPDSRVGMIDLLDGWVRSGQAPTEAAVNEAFGDDSGYDPPFVPGPWPDPAAS